MHARASVDFDNKLAATRAALQQLVLDHTRTPGADTAPVVQASSLGAEDVVVSHLINALELDVGIFVLQTGQLHEETLALLEQLKATSRAPVTVYVPLAEAVVQFVAREGKDAMFKTIALRKAPGTVGRPRRRAAARFVRPGTRQAQPAGRLDLG